MSALSHLLAQASAQGSARLRIDAVFCPPVAPSSAQLRPPGLQTSRLSSFTQRARGRFLIATTARSVTQDTKNADAAREARKEAFSAELVYLKELLLSLARTTNFDEKVGALCCMSMLSVYLWQCSTTTVTAGRQCQALERFLYAC